MKTKIGELYNKPIVIGNPNKVNKDEILLKNDVGGITLSERKDGELEDITNTPPKYPRCFISEFDSGDDMIRGITLYTGNSGINFCETSTFNKNNIILVFNDWAMINGEYTTLDVFLNKYKGKYKEISLKEFMGESSSPNRDLFIINLYSESYINSDNFIFTKIKDLTSVKNFNIISKNLNKHCLLTFTFKEDEVGQSIPYYIRVSNYTLNEENNCIEFNLKDTMPPLNMATQIKVSLDAEVVNN